MPRTITIEKTLFAFDELSDSAKEKARSWWRECEAQDSDTSCTYEDAAQCAEILGIDLRQRPVKLMGGGTRYEPCIWYSGFWSQGDGACFEGTYSYAKGASKKIREHTVNSDSELARIADELQALQRKHFYRVTAATKHSGHYYHSGCMSVDVYLGDGYNTGEYPEAAAAGDAVTQLMRDFADWIYKQLEKEWEWCNADEQVDDNIRADEYEFNADGNIA